MKGLLFILFLWLLSFNVFAEEQGKLNATVWGHDTGWLTFSKAKSVDLYVNDQVQDGCWTDIRGAKNAVELQLIRSGYETRDGEEGSIFTPDVIISAIGYEVGSLELCAVSVSLDATVPDFKEFVADEGVLSALFARTLSNYGAILTSGKGNSNTSIKSQFEGLVQQLLVDVEKSKQRMRATLQEQEDSPGNAYWIEELK